jgi:hypothetical protein
MKSTLLGVCFFVLDTQEIRRFFTGAAVSYSCSVVQTIFSSANFLAFRGGVVGWEGLGIAVDCGAMVDHAAMVAHALVVVGCD